MAMGADGTPLANDEPANRLPEDAPLESQLTNENLLKWLLEDAPRKIQPAQLWPFRPAGDSLR